MLRALLIENDSSFRRAVADILTTQFPSLLLDEAEDAAAALRQVQERKPHIVFLDIDLPDKSGILLAGDIKDVDGGIAIVVLSGHDTPEYRAAAKHHGAGSYICKGAETCRSEILARVAELPVPNAPLNG